MSFFGDIFSPIVSAVGSIFGANEQSNSAEEANQTNLQIARETNKFNAEQAELNRNWQTLANQKAMDFSASQAQTARRESERLSNTSWQRAVDDMRAAGINPMLSVSQGGASSPVMASASGVSSGGSQASGVSARVDPTIKYNRVNAALQAASSAMDVMLKRNQSEAVAAQVRNTNADTANKLLLPSDIQAGIQLKGSQSYQATTQGHVNQYTEEKLRRTIEPLVEQIRASADASRASAEQVRSQNVAVKRLQEIDSTGILAPVLQLIFGLAGGR